MNNTHELNTWETPSDYAGFSPVGDFYAYAQHRDSDVLSRCNYKSIKATLSKIAEGLPSPKITDAFESGSMDTWLYEFRANHWAVGWIDHMLLRQDAPEELCEALQDIQSALADYPVLDDNLFSEMEEEEAQEHWENLSTSYKVELCQDCDISIFSSREKHFPEGVREMLQC